jgi:hypothetical protein
MRSGSWIAVRIWQPRYSLPTAPQFAGAREHLTFGARLRRRDARTIAGARGRDYD